MPHCAQVLLGALALFLHQTVGLAFALEVALAIVTWAVATPAVLIAIAALGFWHLTNCHTPRATARH